MKTLLTARRYASATLCCRRVSVCLPDRLSVTSRYCIETYRDESRWFLAWELFRPIPPSVLNWTCIRLTLKSHKNISGQAAPPVRILMVTVGVLLEIYRNTVLNWRAIDVTYGGLKAILYATTMNIHAELASFAVAHGWTVLEAPRLSDAGVHTCAHLCTPVHTWLDGAGGTAAE